MRNKIIGCILACIAVATVSCNSLNSTITKSEVYRQNHTGFYLFNPETKKVLAAVNGEKYFTPASNTKIFTFYTGLNVLGDSLPGLKYISRNDSLIIWGTGDPSFLHPDLPQSAIFDFLNNRKEKVFLSFENYYDDAFGPGWAWDDYPYYYQPEKASFPMYGNVVHFEKDSGSSQIKIKPDLFKKFLYPDNSTNRYGTIQRDPTNNLFYKKDLPDSIEIDRFLPYKYSPLIVKELLEDTLKRDIGIVSEPLDPLAQTVYSILSDSLYKMMMEDSDNFFAEQVMLMSGVLTDSLNTEIAIDYSKEFLLSDLPDEPIWHDGSGLSRYNLFTPRSIVKLWRKFMILCLKKDFLI